MFLNSSKIKLTLNLNERLFYPAINETQLGAILEHHRAKLINKNFGFVAV